MKEMHIAKKKIQVRHMGTKTTRCWMDGEVAETLQENFLPLKDRDCWCDCDEMWRKHA